MLNRLYNTGKRRQSARPKLRQLNRAEVSAALAASLKQIADLKVEYPDLFKEWSRQEYRARNIHETNSSIVVELEHPPAMDREGNPISSQGGVTTFEVSKNESGTLALGTPRIVLSQNSIRNQSLLPVSTVDRNAAYAAWLIASAWWCEQLEWRLQPPEVGGLLKEKGEPSGPPAKTKEAVEAEQQVRASPQSSGADAATWDTIEISFLSDERVQIRIGTDTKTYNYAELGFEDRRNGKPNQAWVTLRDLAEARGIISVAARSASPWPKIGKRIQEIRNVLRKHFGISSDPVPYVKGTGYQSRFKIGLGPSIHT